MYISGCISVVLVGNFCSLVLLLMKGLNRIACKNTTIQFLIRYMLVAFTYWATTKGPTPSLNPENLAS